MKPVLSLVLTLFLLFSSNISFGQTVNNELKITQITGDFYVYTTYKMFGTKKQDANAMYVVTPEGVILFDSPWDTFPFQSLLDTIEAKHHKKIILAVATHSHEDRTSGLDFYKQLGIKTYTTKQTDEISIEYERPRSEFLIEKDTVFNVGDFKFETYYAGEGHTKDNIVIWFEKQKILYGGCLVKSIDAKDLEYVGEANVTEWPNTIKRVQTKFNKPKFIITGHHDWKSIYSLKHTLDLLRANEKKNKYKK
ncbi:BlaB/IND/MUS family subclass B1 metallo-beta-lactamase [Flavobacterium sp. GSP27]|uniref:BlaB/IND/MUS family subclass B1 metallo-beta-lactamase n=1 Tax=Flavobacterium sp. GSP27 TaxID=2497489 RepID=UPI000F81D60F|nr:BlaB/IND/MUS family subclass B1 metallo-beta-lactamase [Flavobacterium sp. GSP27]RTY96567.1 BlaB/IND/MUS family subclass B1 metallo-beta-lactamase [Flavobacterium sp. GSN2]RTZ10783.1 BlaB/IND/MUS family subclass B1 metallo-beta-lactamase [Flavobacterium sp. GSP27]